MTDATKRANPYAHMSDGELEAACDAMLEGYAERLEYFGELPEWQSARNLKMIVADPGAWGLSRGELGDWCEVLREHWLEAWRLGDAVAERRRRLYEAERDRVARFPDHLSARKEAEAMRPQLGPYAHWKLRCESMRDYVARKECEGDVVALWRGASDGAWEVLEARMRGVTVEQLRADKRREKRRLEADLMARRERRGRAGGKR